jgi:hypothetical protein
MNDQAIMARESRVKEFAKRLGSNNVAVRNPGGPTGGQELSALYSQSIPDCSVVFTIPSLDMSLAEYHSAKDGGATLPGIGESLSGANRPMMEASVLSAASGDAAALEQKDPQNMNKPTSWTKSTLPYASHAVETNVADFFSKLIHSRLRSWTLLLLRHSLSTGETESRSRLLSMLSASIEVQKSETSFKTLDMPPGAMGQSKEADATVLPLLFEVILNLSVQEKVEKVTVRAPGTISGKYKWAFF